MGGSGCERFTNTTTFSSSESARWGASTTRRLGYAPVVFSRLAGADRRTTPATAPDVPCTAAVGTGGTVTNTITASAASARPSAAGAGKRRSPSGIGTNWVIGHGYPTVSAEPDDSPAFAQNHTHG